MSFFFSVGDDAWHDAVGIFLYDARNNAVAPLHAPNHRTIPFNCNFAFYPHKLALCVNVCIGC